MDLRRHDRCLGVSWIRQALRRLTSRWKTADDQMGLLQLHAQHPRLHHSQVRRRDSADAAAEPGPVASCLSLGAGQYLPGGYPWLRRHLVCPVHAFAGAMGLFHHQFQVLESVVVGEVFDGSWMQVPFMTEDQIETKKSNSHSLLTGFSALTDLYLAVYPTIVLFKLQINNKKKIALCSALSIGSVSAIVSIYKSTRLPSLAGADFSWDTTDLVIWSL